MELHPAQAREAPRSHWEAGDSHQDRISRLSRDRSRRGRRETRSLPTSWSPAFLLALPSRPSKCVEATSAGTEARPADCRFLPRIHRAARNSSTATRQTVDPSQTATPGVIAPSLPHAVDGAPKMRCTSYSTTASLVVTRHIGHREHSGRSREASIICSTAARYRASSLVTGSRACALSSDSQPCADGCPPCKNDAASRADRRFCASIAGWPQRRSVRLRGEHGQPGT